MGCTNREQYNKYSRDWARKRRLSKGDGTYIYVEKRDYPEDNNCELCRKHPTKLEYHHWDGNWPEAGLWLCIHCHKIAEAYERGAISKYLQLKQAVEKEVAIRGMPESVKSLVEVGAK